MKKRRFKAVLVASLVALAGCSLPETAATELGQAPAAGNYDAVCKCFHEN